MPKGTQATEFFVVGGPVQPDRACYVTRRADQELLDCIAEQRFAYVLSPRATGKSSLMARTIRRLRNEGQLAAVIDLTQIGARGESADSGRWYYGIAYRIVRELRLKVDLQSWWQEKSTLLGDQRLVEFFWEIVLTHTSAPVTVFFDEAERAASLSFSDELFSAIRSCYQLRVSEPDYARLNFVVLGVATPKQLCKEPSVSPFVDGQSIALPDFALAECYELGRGFGVDAAVSRALIERIYGWTRGHPYLTQKVARGVARKGAKLADVERVVHEQFLTPTAIQEEPLLSQTRAMFVEPLPQTRLALNGLVRIAKRPERFREPGPAARELLLLSGIVDDAAGRLGYRNGIFARVFDERWASSELPVNWQRSVAVAAGIAAVMAMSFWYTQILPRPYVNTLSVVTQDFAVAQDAYERLHRLPGFASTADRLFAEAMVRRSETTMAIADVRAADDVIRALPGMEALADEVMAKYWLRRADAAMHRGRRDDALLYALEARRGQPDAARTLAAELIGSDYARLQRTYRLAEVPIDWEVDWERNEIVAIDQTHRVERLALQPSPSRVADDGAAATRLTALQHVPVTRELRVDAEGAAGAFNLLLTTQHPRAGDLVLRLSAPSGAEAEFAVPQPRADQRELVFSARGDSPLARLVDEDRLGQWQLTLVDRRSGETGLLLKWGLQFAGDQQVWEDEPEQGVPLPDPVRTEQVDITLGERGVLAVAQPTRSGAGGTLGVWDLRDGTLINDLEIPGAAERIVTSSTYRRLLAVTGNALRIWDIDTGDTVAEMTTNTSYVLPPASSGDERFVMIAEAVDATLALYSLVRIDTGEVVSSFAGAAGVREWALGPQAGFLAILESGGRARILDPRSGRVLDQLRHQQDFARLVPVPHDEILVTVDTNGDIYGWQLGGADGSVAITGNWLIGRTSDAGAVSVAARAEGIAFEPAPGLVATADVRGRRSPVYFRVDNSSLAASTRISPDGVRVVTDSGSSFRLWRFAGAGGTARTDKDLSAVAIDAEGGLALFGFRGGNVRVREVGELGRAPAPAENVDYIGHRGAVTSLAINAARDVAASGGSDGVVRVWNLATVAPTEHFLRHPEGPIRALAISRAGDLVVSAAEYSARVWDAHSGALVGDIPVDGAALAVVLSNDGGFVAVGDTAGNIFFGASRGTGPLLSARARGAVTALAISADGGTILSGDTAGTLQLWDAATGTPLRRPYAFDEPLTWVDFGADGRTVFARSGSWVHELVVADEGLAVVASRLLPIRLGPDAVPAAPTDEAIRWLAGPTQGALDYLDLPMRGAPPASIAPDSSVLDRDWSSILGLSIDAATGTTVAR